MTDIPANVTTTAMFDGDPLTGASFAGDFESYYDNDWVQVFLRPGYTYSFYGDTASAGGTSSTSVLHLYDFAGNPLVAQDISGGGPNSAISYTAAAIGTYYLEVPLVVGTPGQYTVSVTAVAAADHELSAGNDTYTGVAGERIIAGAGNDVIHIGAGLDALGEQGNDTLTGNGSNNFISGGSGDDTISGDIGDDSLFGDVGNDLITGGDGADKISGGDGIDVISGGTGSDVIHGGDGADSIFGAGPDGYTPIDHNTLFGDGGDDRLRGDNGPDKLDGGTGADSMSGFDGNDSYFVDNGGDIVDETGTTGVDKINSSISFNMSDGTHAFGNIENLVLTGTANIDGSGNALANILTGNAGNNILSGNDGRDNLQGGAGNDRLIGGLGNDLLTGGAGADTFVFTTVAESADRYTQDLIRDFSQAETDRIDVSAIDADTITGGAQHFAFIGTSAFSHHAGELHYVTSPGRTAISGDVNGDGVADFSLILTGVISLHAGDFVL